MTLDITNKNHVGRVAGRTVLYIGAECSNWSIDQMVQAARQARALGIDTISPRRSEGTIKYYGTPTNLQAEAKAVNAAGCGYLPFGYCYGPRFGLGFVTQECAILTEMQEAMAALQPDGIGFACADLEIEYNGRVDAAAIFARAMQNKHLLWLTSWADPAWQSWNGVLNVLRSCINAYVPQSYSDQLNVLEIQQVPGDLCVQVAVDLSQEFGPNHPVQIAAQAVARGDTTVWMWDYTFIGSQRANASGVVQALRGVSLPSSPLPPPAPTPQPPPPPAKQEYAIVAGDSLSTIAEKLGVAEPTLFAENKDHLDATARNYGHSDSENGNLIFPGDMITY